MGALERLSGEPQRPMSAPATHFPPVSAARRCPACNSPISSRAAVCALCDTVLDPAALAAAATAPRVKVREKVRFGPVLVAFLVRTAMVLGVVAVLVGGMAALLVNAGQKRMMRRAARFAAEFEASRAQSTWPSLDTGITAATRALGGGVVADETAAANMAAYARKGIPSDGYLRGDGEVAPAPAHRAVPAPLRLAVFEHLPARPSRATLDSLAGDTLDARLAAWRALARSAPLPVLWPYASARFGELRDPFVIPDLPFGVSKELAGRNSSAAAVAFAKGDVATATTRLRENVAVAGQLMRVPLLLNHLVGRAIAGDAGVQLGHVARATGDSALAREAARLTSVSDRRNGSFRFVQAVPMYFADPEDPRGPALVGDRTLSPGQRVVALGGVASGFCMRTSEVLFGVSEKRRETLRRAAQNLADVDGAQPMVALHERWLDDLIERPVETLRTMGRLRGTTRLPRTASMPLLGGVTARAVTCMRLM